MGNQISKFTNLVGQNKFVAALILGHLFLYFRAISFAQEWVFVLINLSVWFILLGPPFAFVRPALLRLYNDARSGSYFILFLIAILNLGLSSDPSGWQTIAWGAGSWFVIIAIFFAYYRYGNKSLIIKNAGRLFFALFAVAIIALLGVRLLIGVQ